MKVADWALLAVRVRASEVGPKKSVMAKGMRISFVTGAEKVMVRGSVPKKLLSVRPVLKGNRPAVFWTVKPLPAGEVKVAVRAPEVMLKVGAVPGATVARLKVVAWAPDAEGEEEGGGEEEVSAHF